MKASNLNVESLGLVGLPQLGASILGYNVNINYDIGWHGMFSSRPRAESARVSIGRQSPRSGME